MAKSYLEGIAGDLDGKRPTMDRFVRHLPAAGISCCINVAGGALASGVVKEIGGKWQGMGEIGVALLAVAMKAWFQPIDDFGAAMRELASGMAGHVGHALWEELRLWMKADRWAVGKVYKAGSLVRHEKAFWQSSGDIPATPTAEPGRDSRWIRVEGSGVNEGVLKKAAQALWDSDRVAGLTDDVLDYVGGHVEESTGYKWDTDAKLGLRKRMMDALSEAVQAAG